MYLFDWRKTVANLRSLTQSMAPAPARWGAWAQNMNIEQEMAVQAVEFLFDHLIQFEQFTAAAHLLAWATPVNIRTNPKILEMAKYALTICDAIGDPLHEELKAKAGLHEIEDNFILTPVALPPRAAFWLHVTRIRGSKAALEYATGCGSNVMHLAQIEPNIEWWGTDASAAQVDANNEQAKKLNLNAHFARFDSNMKFDSVAALDVLEHTAYPMEFLDKAEQWCARDGLMTAVVPKGPWSLSTHNDVGVELVGNHINVSSVGDMILMAQKRGIVVAAENRPGPVAHDINGSACVAYRPFQKE